MTKTTALPPLKVSEQKPKLTKLPSNSKISKRPLLHAPISSKHTGANTQKCVYISHSTPFIAAVKRVRAYLEAIDRRDNPLLHAFPPKNQRYGRTIGLSESKSMEEAEEVVIKGTGKAIEKVLQLALYFQGQDDCKTVIRTGSAGAIDDVQTPAEDGEELGEEISRVRRVSCLEVGVKLQR